MEMVLATKSASECPGQRRREICHVFLQGKPALNEGWERRRNCGGGMMRGRLEGNGAFERSRLGETGCDAD